MAKPKELGDKIREELLKGRKQREVAAMFAISTGTVAYHAKKLGIQKKQA